MATPVRTTVRRRRLGKALRTKREGLGWKLDRAAAELLISVPSLSRIETGSQGLRPSGLLGFFTRYGIDEKSPEGQHLLALAKNSQQKGWWQAQEYSGIVGDPFDDYLSLEEDARQLDQWFAVLIPGLLQTPEYAEAVIEASRVWSTPEQVAAFAKLRMERQKVLTRTDPPPVKIWAIVAESAIRQPVGGPDANRRQIAHLLEMMALPTVTVQMLPSAVGAHAGMDGSFTLMRFPVGEPVACIEPMTASLYLEDERDIERYEAAFSHVKAASLSPRDTKLTLSKMIKERT